MGVSASDTISSQEIVTKYGISYQTLNYYTNLGFLHAITKQGNRRFYRDDEVKKALSTIRHLRSQGFPLRLIGRFLHSGQSTALLETLLMK